MTEPLYEDNHLIIVAKKAGEICQGDKTGDAPLSDAVKAYIKEKCAKPGQVFLGLVHRIDRPVSGALCFARTSKALARMNALFAEGHQVEKTYLALVEKAPAEPEGTLVHWLTRNPKNNTAKAHNREVAGSKRAELSYRTLGHTERYTLLEIILKTGRHHQIRCQLAHIGSIIRGDLKYGARRSNPDGSISLHAYRLRFAHPVSHIPIDVTAPLPNDPVWQAAQAILNPQS